MTHPYSLAFLTTFDAGPVEAVKISAQAGYDMVGLRFLPAALGEPDYPIMTDKAVQREVSAALSDTGIQLADIEIARLKPDTNVATFEAFCALGRNLGARNILVAGDDEDHVRLTDTFARFSELAAQYEMTADLEFMPWTGVKTLNEAYEIVKNSGAENAGVLIDALHFDRSDSTLDDIKALPAQYIHYAQLCDGPAQYDPSDAGLIEIARGARLLPGEGGIDLSGIIDGLPSKTVLSVEIPHLVRAETESPLERAIDALAASKKIGAQIR